MVLILESKLVSGAATNYARTSLLYEPLSSPDRFCIILAVERALEIPRSFHLTHRMQASHRMSWKLNPEATKVAPVLSLKDGNSECALWSARLICNLIRNVSLALLVCTSNCTISDCNGSANAVPITAPMCNLPICGLLAVH